VSVTPTDVWYGCRREHAYAGGLVQVHASDRIAQEFHGGIALDLNAGKVYVLVDGRWTDGEPGTSGGLTVKLGETYRCGVETTALLKPLLDNGSIRINYGAKPFTYPMPEGYRPFIDGGQ
jgi:hypothetical protein